MFVKSTILFGFFLFSLSIALFAQEDVKFENSNKRSLEIFIGPSLVSNYDNKEYEEYGIPKIGYHFGFNVRQSIARNISVSTSIGFYRKGFKEEISLFQPPDLYNNPPTNDLPPEEVTLDANLDSDYLLLNILAQLDLFKDKLMISAGFYVGRLFKSTLTKRYSLRGNLVRELTDDLTNSYQEYDYGLSFLSGYRFDLINPKDAQIAFGLDYGLRNYQILNTAGLLPRKNLSINLRLSYKII